MIAYLSGAMEYANDEGESWRTNITEWLSKNLNHSVINPVKESRVIIDKKDLIRRTRDNLISMSKHEIVNYGP